MNGYGFYGNQWCNSNLDNVWNVTQLPPTQFTPIYYTQIISAPGPCKYSGGACGQYSGQKARSSQNVRLASGRYQVVAPPGIGFNIYQDIPRGNDVRYGTFFTGATLNVPSGNFYIANPSGTNTDFTVVFNSIPLTY